jgi:hypothetical protein
MLQLLLYNSLLIHYILNISVAALTSVLYGLSEGNKDGIVQIPIHLISTPSYWPCFREDTHSYLHRI